MKKQSILLTAALAVSLSVTAQEPNGVLVVEEDSGRTEVIALPEGMNVTDSELMDDYNNRTNLTEAADQVPPAPQQDILSSEDLLIVDRLSRIPTTIDMPLNDITRTFINTYSNRMRHSVAIMLGASNFYMPIFEEALERYELPLELRYLPVIESALRPSATSHAGAAGLWQFMPATGKRYGLEINTLVDERRDPIKSSEAAAHFLSDLYNMFGDWSLAIAAYNCGEYNVQKALLRSGNRDGDFWSIYNYLPHETRGYVPAFIAANYIMTYYCEHGITPMQATLPAESDTVVVAQDVSFAKITSLCNVTMDELRVLNPQYRRDIVPRDYVLRLPAQAIEAFVLNEDSLYGFRRGGRPAIEPGSVSIGLTTTEESASEPQTSYYDRPTYTSSKKNSRSTRSSRKNSRRRNQTRSVSVKSGDSLSAIARRNGTTVSNLRRLNNIKGSTIHPGQKIRVK
ncbi:MAG: transglycosylase SLT domain-containing protein [Bacteroidales bacterium]|nr:transglycosylase SLT domain-containing protein [Bacteroidales bacterium]